MDVKVSKVMLRMMTAVSAAEVHLSYQPMLSARTLRGLMDHYAPRSAVWLFCCSLGPSAISLNVCIECEINH